MTTMTVEADRSLVNLTHLTYGLHAVGLALGIFGASTVVGAFLGFPSLIALIINYVKRGEMRGTWLESHVTWQIRTFWWVLAWAVAKSEDGEVLEKPSDLFARVAENIAAAERTWGADDARVADLCCRLDGGHGADDGQVQH